MKNRFIKHANSIEKLSSKKKVLSFFEKMKLAYHKEHIKITISKMKLWGSKIDTSYFYLNTTEKIMEFSKACEAYTNREISLRTCYNTMEEIDWQNLKVKRF
jgi:hypothetical protein